MKPKAIARALLGLIASVAGGALFFRLGIPLPWMLGSLTVAATIAVLGLRLELPAFSRQFAVPMVGVVAGSAFTQSIVLSMVQWWTVIPILAAFLITTTLIGRAFFMRVCGHDSTTAFFASAPAGLGELTPVAAMFGANVRTVVLIHSMRVITVAFIVPFTVLTFVEHTGGLLPMQQHGTLSVMDWLVLVLCAGGGWLIGWPLRTMGGLMTGPLILSALVHATGVTDLVPPAWLLAVMQVVIGSVAGARFAGTKWREARLTILQGLGWSLFVLLAAVATAAVSVGVVGMPLTALVLAFTPGGLAEITIVTYTIGIEVAFVVMCHVFRAVSVMTFAPITFRFCRGKPPKLPPPST